MTIAYIGSVALQLSGVIDRVPNDTDIVADYESLQALHKQLDLVKVYPFANGDKYYTETREGAIYESEIAWEGSLSDELLQLIMDDYASYKDSKGNYWASLDVLYMLKMSHRYLRNSVHFKKTMDDIIAMRKHGAVIRPEHEDFYKRRCDATYNYGHPSLKRSKEDFFSGDGITYEFRHDDIHLAVKTLDFPAYTYFSGGEVWSDMKKFETLPEEIKLLAVLEESLVLAAERSQLAFDNVDPDWSFETALMKVCTSITSGKFRCYAWENYYKVMYLYEALGKGYMDRVRAGIASGLVKRVKEGV